MAARELQVIAWVAALTLSLANSFSESFLSCSAAFSVSAPSLFSFTSGLQWGKRKDRVKFAALEQKQSPPLSYLRWLW